jgi:hypothetical protein
LSRFATLPLPLKPGIASRLSTADPPTRSAAGRSPTMPRILPSLHPHSMIHPCPSLSDPQHIPLSRSPCCPLPRVAP